MMTRDWPTRKAHYQQASSSVQLGGLASNLHRIAWHAQRRMTIHPMLFRESKYFTEWAASACSLEQQGMLATLQQQLAWWERGWGTRVSHEGIARDALQWSAKLLEAAGLLDR